MTTATAEKFKQGDIVRNRWAGDKNPTRYFIVWEIRGSKVSVIELDGNKLNFEGYSYSNIYEPHHDSGESAFVKVGETKAFEIMKQDLAVFFKGVELNASNSRETNVSIRVRTR